jgi:hypothetical protein
MENDYGEDVDISPVEMMAYLPNGVMAMFGSQDRRMSDLLWESGHE